MKDLQKQLNKIQFSAGSKRESPKEQVLEHHSKFKRAKYNKRKIKTTKYQ